MFEVLLLCYGDYKDLAERCLNSVISNRINTDLKIHVGLNECSKTTKEFCRSLLDQNIICTLIDSNINLNKDPMMRKLIDCVSGEYFLWLDDDSYIDRTGWDVELSDIIKANPNIDIFGFPHVSGRNQYYNNILQQRPWYKANKKRKSQINFPIGGFWIAKKSYLEKYNYPDKGLYTREHQHMDDRLLGDLLTFTDGRFYTLSGWESHFFINKAPRRGK